jgi:hypothetical protein
LMPCPEWQTIGLCGERVPGFQGLPEFTFVCPNKPAVQEAVQARVREVARAGQYEGLFLDRIRFPSPAADPEIGLACFCPDCQAEASREGLDLEGARRQIGALLSSPEGTWSLVRALFDAEDGAGGAGELALRALLRFRRASVSRLVAAVAREIRAAGLEVGLDCFSPALAGMVGQDLGALAGCSDWVKVMSYGHTLGPAGLPFELLGLIDWLARREAMDRREAIMRLSRASGLGLPASAEELRDNGLSSAALASEVRAARRQGVTALLAGIELVELEGIAHLAQRQVEADLRAFRGASVDGLVLSWDLWHIPPERLEWVRAAWGPAVRDPAGMA